MHCPYLLLNGIYLKNPKVSRTTGPVCLFVNNVCDTGFASFVSLR